MRILYISFFSTPLNSIPSLRTNAFLKYLPESGVEIDVLTRYYDEKNRSGNDFNITFSEVEELKEVDKKVGNIVYSNFKSNTKGIKFFYSLPYGLKTLYSFYHKDIYHSGWIKCALESYEKNFSQNKYDFIVASYNPIVSLQVASILSKKYNIPWVADFRDTFIGIERETKFTTWYKKLLINSILKSSTGIVAVCQGILNQLDQYGTTAIRNIPREVVNNGVDAAVEPRVEKDDEEIVENIIKIKDASSLLFIHTGTIYEGQDMDFFLDFMNAYNSKNLFKINIVCLGLTKDRVNFNSLEEKGAFIFGRVKNSTSLFIQNLADALIIPAWYQERYTGFVGKIFEYIHSGNNVVCSPAPPMDLKEFLSGFQNVHLAKSYEDMESYVNNLIRIRANQVKPKNNDLRLFRSFWIEKLATFLKDLKT